MSMATVACAGLHRRSRQLKMTPSSGRRLPDHNPQSESVQGSAIGREVGPDHSRAAPRAR
jgi:hypothetical protein